MLKRGVSLSFILIEIPPLFIREGEWGVGLGRILIVGGSSAKPEAEDKEQQTADSYHRI